MSMGPVGEGPSMGTLALSLSSLRLYWDLNSGSQAPGPTLSHFHVLQ